MKRRLEQKPIYLLQFFHLSLACSFNRCSNLNRCQIFALMRAVSQTSLAVRAARAAPETLLCESLQWCVKDKHVVHSESQGSLSHFISVMKCFPPPALRIQACALPQTNPSRVAHMCDDTTMVLSKGCFLLTSTTLSASCLVC